MVETAFYIWLLGSVLIFVAVAMSGQATDRSQAIWLLLLAASWPFVLVFMAIGAVLLAISAGASTRP
jgi:uncharacterized membrane protein